MPSSPTASKLESAVPRHQLMVYPGYGYWDARDAHWRVVVQGSSFHPWTDGLRRRLVFRLLRRLMRATADDLQSHLFQRRIRAFLSTSRRRHPLGLSLGGRTFWVRNRFGRNGEFRTVIRLAPEQVTEMESRGVICNGWLNLSAALPAGEVSRVVGRAQLVPQQGISVISDIDDTIKHSQVADRRHLLANTFLREFSPIPGMAAIYSRWSQAGAFFHYVSSSPWQLFECLQELLHESGFPDGSYHLRTLRLRDPSVLRLFLARRLAKRNAIARILHHFPERRFILVGDSGERDPEIYGALARRYPRQIVRILIHKVAGRRLHADRCRRAFRQIPFDTWRIFQHAEQLAEWLPPAEIGQWA